MSHHVNIRSTANFLKADAFWFRSRCSFVRVTGLPLKQKELPVEAPPRVLQNSVFDGQKIRYFRNGGVLRHFNLSNCNAGANGELQITVHCDKIPIQMSKSYYLHRKASARYQKMKFHVERTDGEIRGDEKVARKCYV